MQPLKDARYALRTLKRNPGFTAVAVTALALGIGANTAIFSVVNAALIRPLPYPESNRLVTIWQTNPALQLGIDLLPVSIPNYIDWRAQNHVFDNIGLLLSEELNLSGAGDPQRLVAARVSASFFDVLGVKPLLGRTFLPQEDIAGSARVAVIGYGLWQRRWGGDPSVVGRAVRLSGQTYTIAGVMPSGFAFPKGSEMPSYCQFEPRTELWVPAALEPYRFKNRGSLNAIAIARVKRGIRVAQAQAEMHTIAANLAKQYPEDFGWGAKVVALHANIVSEIRPALLVLMTAVGCVLLIACANVANLLLARAAGRRREIAIRLTMGARRPHLVLQMLTESVLLALAGGCAGLALAFAGVRTLAALAPAGLPLVHGAGLDLTVVAFTFGISLLTGVLFGLAPALESSRADLSQTLKEGGRSLGGGTRHWFRNFLVAAEVALALVLLIGAGLLIKSFLKLHSVDPGFHPERVLAFELNLPDSYSPEGRRNQFFKALLDSIRTLPGVSAAAAISEVPLGGREEVEAVTIEGRPARPNQALAADAREITPGYFQAMGIPLLRGRAIDARDSKDSPKVAMIDETMARQYWPGQDPVGKRFHLGDENSKAPWLTVAGIAGSVRHSALGAEGRPEFFLPLAQREYSQMAVVVRSAVDPRSLVQSVKREVWRLDKELPLAKITTLEDLVSDSVALPRFRSLLLGVFAGLALLLACIGIYGVMSYLVTQRTHEIGLRMALGAAQRDVLKLVVGQGLALALAGAAAGLVLAFALARLLSGLLFGVTPSDALTYAGISALLLGVAFLACYIPARRAARVDPMVALRYD